MNGDPADTDDNQSVRSIVKWVMQIKARMCLKLANRLRTIRTIVIMLLLLVSLTACEETQTDTPSSSKAWRDAEQQLDMPSPSQVLRDAERLGSGVLLGETPYRDNPFPLGTLFLIDDSDSEWYVEHNRVKVEIIAQVTDEKWVSEDVHTLVVYYERNDDGEWTASGIDAGQPVIRVVPRNQIASISWTDVDTNKTTLIDDGEILDVFEHYFNSSAEQAGIVHMASPPYQLDITYENRSPDRVNLFIDERDGRSSFVYGKDTNTAYIVVEQPTRMLKNVLYEKGLLQPHRLFGIVAIEDNVVHVDEVELVTTPYADRLLGLSLHDPERMAELGLTDDDMPNGYVVHSPDDGFATYELTGDTVYAYVEEGGVKVEDGDQDRFLRHLQATYGGMAETVPFYLEVREGQVIRIEEKVLLTQ